MADPCLPPSFIRPKELEETARKFLSEYNPKAAVPVPIEEIVEFRLHLNIIPIPNLYRDFKIDGWLSLGQHSIHVDEIQLAQFETRYRFTLAHEVSHLLLHRELYEQMPFDSFVEWLQFYETADQAIVSDYEWQARNVAGRILVPQEPLVKIGQKLLLKVPSDLRERASSEEILRTLSLPLADEFNVHPSVVEIRLMGDKIGSRLLQPEQ